MRTEHHLPGVLEAPAQSRRLVADALGDHPRSQDVVLATSELVANALTHGKAADITLGIERHRDSIHVWVEHPGQTFDPHVARDFHGLGFVEQLADGWGIEENDGIVRVWFEMGGAELPVDESHDTQQR